MASRPFAGASRLHWLAAAIAASLLALFVHAPALEGEFASDDRFCIVANPYVHALSAENLGALLDPRGAPAAITVNYAPVHLLLHALEWQAFGREGLIGWHLVNVLAHVVTTLLLVGLLLAWGLPPLAAFGSGALFLAHPANVEAVAWIFQLKTIVALGLAICALWLEPRRPALALAFFALALLTKITAAFALPVALAGAWCRRDASGRAWLGAWTVAVLVTVTLGFLAFGEGGDGDSPYAGPVEHALTIVSLVGRYAVLATTTVGLSTFHATPAARGLLDPWVLLGLAVVAGIGWRTVQALRRRDTEAALWVWAAASFVPISQLVPFPSPMADRYLYAILPGLLGAGALALGPLVGAARERLGAPAAARLAVVLLLLATAGLTVRARERAPVFASDAAMMQDAARNHPLGMSGHLARLDVAAARGDGPAAARALAGAIDEGYADLAGLLQSPALVGVRRHPGFQAQVLRLARQDVAELGGRSRLHAFQRFRLAVALEQLGRREEAIAVLEPARDDAGPFGPVGRALLESLSSSP